MPYIVTFAKKYISMRKLTFDTLPGAIAEILERLDRVEQLLSGETPSKAKVKKLETKRAEESIDIKNAAKILNVSMASLYSYVKNKRIPFKKKGGKLAFSRTALETWRQEKVNSKKVSGKKDNNRNPDESITATEAQKFFNKPLASIYYIIKTRKLQVIEKKGRAKYYSKNELSKALKGKQKRSDKRSS
jgi:excisionase family DNA binding protein